MTSSPPSPPEQPQTSVGHPALRHWVLLAILIVCGGSSFAGIRLAVETAPPAIVAAGRLWGAAVVLYIYMRATGRPMLRLRNENGGLARVWMYAITIAAVGYAVPMVLFPFAQQTVSSMLAGIYMAFMPIVTVFLAASFADEPLTRRKLIGFAAGTTGVIILIGPYALKDIFSADVVAQGALILANIGYAVATVVMRRAPDAPARSFAVAIMLSAAVLATPAALTQLGSLRDISAGSWAAIVYLGIVPTGLTAIVIINIIRGAGAGFMAMGNYVTPFVAIVIGIILFGEVLEWRYALGLIVILAGLAIAQPGPSRALAAWVARQQKR